ncbi:MAG: WecB/TagA/CpsF family glycosyltransferase [Bosea sp. (in: a-proteobacteria)]
MPEAPAPSRDLAGIEIAALKAGDALALVASHMAPGQHLKLAFCNAHVVNLGWTNEAFRACLQHFLVLPDGIGVDIGARMLHGQPFPANLNGTDFVPKLLETAGRPLSVMLLGARPGVGEVAAERLSARFPQHSIELLHHGYFTAAEEPDLLARLAETRPDLLLVGFGNPRQEQWIAQHLTSVHCGVAAAIGAFIDFGAGEVSRAPELVRNLRLEWVYRLALEPSRLWRRYVLGNPLFLMRMLKLRLKGRG